MSEIEILLRFLLLDNDQIHGSIKFFERPEEPRDGQYKS